MGTQVLSSLPLQIMFLFNAWYYAAFFIAECLMYIYKAEILPYPRADLAQEIIVLLLLTGVEFFRQYLGKRGNLTERKVPVLISMLLGVACVICLLYFILWQTYVLRFEVIICGVQIAFIAVQILFSILAFISFARNESYS
ncbi:transmembrane protein 216-like [Symsagittifera roscoffensis]|uniref:transmembrane protein 216-like n=1 Tax=Symsagittifera roscoffensis TaxID=84072 RepID=UPI00307B5D73